MRIPDCCVHGDGSTFEMARPPKYLNLTQIRLPLPALVSILHRLSGGALFIALPGILYEFQQSLESATTFDSFKALLARGDSKSIVLVVLGAYFYHLCAGLRHLAFDLHFGLGLTAARVTSVMTLAAALLLTLAAGVFLW
jgi:succinate dehydrogenase / fumarate reductase cytochrome b subunit